MTAATHDVSIQITRKHVREQITRFIAFRRSITPAVQDGPEAPPSRFASTFRKASLMPSVLLSLPDFRQSAPALEPAEAEATLLQLLQWRGERNLMPPAART